MMNLLALISYAKRSVKPTSVPGFPIQVHTCCGTQSPAVCLTVAARSRKSLMSYGIAHLIQRSFTPSSTAEIYARSPCHGRGGEYEPANEFAVSCPPLLTRTSAFRLRAAHYGACLAKLRTLY